MPGDLVQSLVSRQGFGHPIWERYVNFWASLLHGDLGGSVYLTCRPVTSVIMSAVPYTLALLCRPFA